MIHIRSASNADRAAILRIWHQGWHDAHARLVPPELLAFRTPAHFALWLDQSPDPFHVAVDREVLGFVSLNGSEIMRLYVDRAARGTGLAGFLLEFAEQGLRAEGCLAAELFCAAGNIRAERFYIRQGWALSRTFEEALWIPEGIARSHTIPTHHYRKVLTAPP